MQSNFARRNAHRSLAFAMRFVIVLFGLFLANGTLCAQEQDKVPEADVLTVDQAVKIALANNRTLKIVSLNLDVNKEKLAADKTRRLPSFNSYIFGSQLLTSISYTIPAGQFGTYPGIGPIPAGPYRGETRHGRTVPTSGD